MPPRRLSALKRTIAIRALGPVDVSVDGKPAPAELLWKRPLALLLYLARSPRRARTREHLVGLLWPEQPAKAAHHSLNEALRILRRSGGAELVTSLGDQIRLDAKRLDLDFERFDGLLTAKDWAGACGLVGGTFLEGFGVSGSSGVEDWLRVEREAWGRKGVRALLEHADELLDAGQNDRAIEQATRAVELDPLSEPAARTLVRALALNGLRADALQAYESFAERLGGALGTRPDRETAMLIERIRTSRPARRPVTPDAPSRRTPMIGRERELARLLGTWRTCKTSSKAAVALVLGDAGMGKTRLADELIDRIRLDGGAVATARAVASDLEEPFGGLLALADGGLADAPGVVATPAESLGALAARSSGWAERFPKAPRDATVAVRRAVRDVCRAVSEDQPLALLVDDAQWLDTDSLTGLGALLRDLARRPVLVVLTAAEHPVRPEIDELRSKLKRDVAGMTVRLGALSRDELLALGRWALPDYNDAALDRVTRRIATDSAGLPLLAVELFEGVAAGLELGRTASAWPEPFRTLDQTMPGGFPDAVVGAIRVNFHRVSADGRAVLAAIAVLGERVPATKLAKATGLSSDALTSALDELEWLRWITADPRGYAFVARVVGEVVARDMVTTGQRERIRVSGS